jgi:hypothetical protein
MESILIKEEKNKELRAEINPFTNLYKYTMEYKTSPLPVASSIVRNWSRDYEYAMDCYEYVDIFPVIVDFYVLEALSLLEKPPRRVDYSKFATWRAELLEFQKNYIKHCAQSLRDCLAAMAFSEARHSFDQVSNKDKRFMIMFGHHGDCCLKKKQVIYKFIHEFHPQQVAMISDVFRDSNWMRCFGGEKWVDICRKVNLYGKTTDKLFCDSVFNSVHNDGIAFSKEFIFNHNILYRSLITDFLNHRATVNNILNHSFYRPVPLSFDVFNLFLTACRLKLVSTFWYEDPSENFPAFIEHYIPVGNIKFKKIEWENTEQITIRTLILKDKEASTQNPSNWIEENDC